MLRYLIAIALAAIATTAAARPYVDQQAPYGTAVIEVGGDRDIVVAQTVTAGLRGDLMRVELGVACKSGELVLEIHNMWPRRPVPGPAVRSRLTIPAASVPEPLTVRTFELDSWPAMEPGEKFSIVLRNDSGSCVVLKGPLFDLATSYRGGEGFFRPAWSDLETWFQFLDFGDEADLGFKTIVNVPVASPQCVVNGFSLPFQSWAPVCRCLQDEGLRELRCALMHPSYFLFRTIPAPLRAGQKFKVRWTLVRHGPMEGVVEVADALAPGFGGVPKTPLTFFVSQLPVGGSMTLEYEAVAPAKPGKYHLDARVEDGTVQTMIEVVP